MLNYKLGRDLSQSEKEILSYLTGSLVRYKLPDTFKVLCTHTHCACGLSYAQYVKMAKWSDGTWLKEKDREITDKEKETAEVFEVKCRNCLNCLDKESVPEVAASYYQNLIASQYHYLMSLTRGKNVSTDFVYETIKTSAVRAALCYHEPENWRKYIPKSLKGRIE
jgi:hypothetical protein